MPPAAEGATLHHTDAAPGTGDRRARELYKDERRREPCRYYNKGRCTRLYCKFTHACPECQEHHPS
eukprot:13625378-Heterocapsa_arctica.AAC.1